MAGDYKKTVVPFELAVRVPAESHLASLAESAGALVSLARVAEGSGADAYLLSRAGGGRAVFDPFVLLGAAAGATSKVRLGAVATPAGERHPSLLAKALASLDVTSHGRAVGCLTFAEGSRDPAGELAESLAIVRAMLEVPGASFRGEHWSVFGAWNEPRVHRRTHFPLGVLVEADTSSTSAAEVLVAVAEHAGFLVAPAGSRPPGVIPSAGIVPVGAERGPGEVAALSRTARAAGFAAVILDWATAPTGEQLAEVVGAARAEAA